MDRCLLQRQAHNLNQRGSRPPSPWAKSSIGYSKKKVHFLEIPRTGLKRLTKIRSYIFWLTPTFQHIKDIHSFWVLLHRGHPVDCYTLQVALNTIQVEIPQRHFTTNSAGNNWKSLKNMASVQYNETVSNFDSIYSQLPDETFPHKIFFCKCKLFDSVVMKQFSGSCF